VIYIWVSIDHYFSWSIIMNISIVYWYNNSPKHIMLCLPAIHLTSSHLLPSLIGPGDSQPPFIPLPLPPFVSVLSCIQRPHSIWFTPENTRGKRGFSQLPPYQPAMHLWLHTDFIFWILSTSVSSETTCFWAENAWLPMIILTITHKRNRPENDVLKLLC